MKKLKAVALAYDARVERRILLLKLGFIFVMMWAVALHAQPPVADNTGKESEVPAVAPDHAYALDGGLESKPVADKAPESSESLKGQKTSEDIFLERATAPGKGVATEANSAAGTTLPAVPASRNTGANANAAANEAAPTVDAAPAAASTEAVTSTGVSAEEFSDGSRVAIEGKGFSIAPPVGWKIRRDLPRTSLFLQANALSATEYPRNIAVLKFQGPTLINQTSADKFAQFLVKNFPSASPEIADYQLRNHQAIQMADGREGILFYTDFSVRGQAMMQAHILLSSETAHYLVTFTDIADHFENPQGSGEYLATAWAAMTSIELDSPNPQPMESMQSTAIVIGFIVLLGGVIAYARHRAAGSIYRDYGDMDPGEAEQLEPKSHAAQSDIDDDALKSQYSSLEGAVEGAPLETGQAQIFEFKTKLEAFANRGEDSNKKSNKKSVSHKPVNGMNIEGFTDDAQLTGDKQWNLKKDEEPVSKEEEELPKDQWKVS